ncbi:SDR family NAD(P)-dependent oxidoreductase [Rhodococcus sp. NPDC059968]|uniref:SDR family NAD(P)-dependent oxidoreductase n=1 Tax=Rhodococcus sp. NPDC059968 TaxID=3347017 RepID=UPI00366DA6BF
MPSDATATPHIVLVTGASRGVGRAVARAFAATGAKIALGGRDVAALEGVAKECGGLGSQETVVLPFDVTDEYACRNAVATAAAELGPITTLVNNAGIAESSPFMRTTLDQWRRTMTVDVEAPFILTQSVLPGMLASGAGAVINIASVAAKLGLPYVAAYTAAKHAMLGMTRSAAAEFASAGVTFNCICPFYVDTEMTRATIANIVEKTGRTEEQAMENLVSPQGRLIDPTHIAELCVFLASPAARSITGQAYNIDGGLVQS